MADGYRVCSSSLGWHTPPGVAAPALLGSFFEWAATVPAGSLGYFRLQGDRLDDWWIEDGSRRATAFVSFLRVVDGSRVGWWRPNGESLDEAPIVLLGGEGEQRVIAGSLGGFLVEVAMGRTEIDDMASDAASDGLSALRAWLERRGVRDEERRDVAPATERLRAWFDEWSAARAQIARSAPERRAIAELLRDVVGLPSAAEPWQRTFAELVLTGTQCALFGSLCGARPLPMLTGFESVARSFRDRDVAEMPEAGLWFRAKLTLDSAGALTVSRTYLEEPKPADVVLDDTGLRQDAARMPRSAYWLPEWLARRIGA
jgi:hypothetical protein